jgi:hypothetical protein
LLGQQFAFLLGRSERAVPKWDVSKKGNCGKPVENTPGGGENASAEDLKPYI